MGSKAQRQVGSAPGYCFHSSECSQTKSLYRRRTVVSAFANCGRLDCDAQLLVRVGSGVRVVFCCASASMLQHKSWDVEKEGRKHATEERREAKERKRIHQTWQQTLKDVKAFSPLPIVTGSETLTSMRVAAACRAPLIHPRCVRTGKATQYALSKYRTSQTARIVGSHAVPEVGAGGARGPLDDTQKCIVGREAVSAAWERRDFAALRACDGGGSKVAVRDSAQRVATVEAEGVKARQRFRGLHGRREVIWLHAH